MYNALAAAAVGAALDVPVEHAARALGEFRPSKLRGQVVERNGIRLLNDSYNANPRLDAGGSGDIGADVHHGRRTSGGCAGRHA